MQQLHLDPVPSPAATRPAGILLLAAASAGVALYLAATGVLVAAGRIAFAWGATLLGGMETAGPFAFWIASAVFAINSLGLFLRRGWSRRLTMFLAAAGIALAVPAISSATAEAQVLRIVQQGVGVIARVVVIWYCTQEDTREWFTQ